MNIITAKLANDIPDELIKELKRIDYNKITDKDINDIIKMYNDFKIIIPLKKQIILSERVITAPEEIIKIINSIDFKKSNKNIIQIAINFLKKNIR